jgi:hypothetical protein
MSIRNQLLADEMKIDYFHKNPNAIKLAVALAALLIVFVPLKSTIALAFKYNALKDRVKTYVTATQKSSITKSSDKLLSDIDHERKIFEEISRACQDHKVVVKQVDLPKTVNESGVITQTQEILLEGDYINILKSLRDISSSLDPIKVASIKFEREENNKRIALVAHIVFQSVKLADEDED